MPTNEMKWCQNKNDAFILSLTAWFWCPLAFFLFVSLQRVWYRFFQLITDIVVCWCKEKRKRVNCWWMSFVSSFFCLHHTDWVQWVLCLISMIHSMTLLLFLQSYCLLIWRDKKEWIVDWCLLYVFFLLSSLPRSSTVSVVFDFNDSLNDIAPVYPILLTVDVKRNEKRELLMDVFCVSSFFCFHSSDQAQWVLCLISILHSMTLLLCLQSYCLLVRWEMKRVICRWMSFVCHLLSSQPKLSSVSVMFDLNDSLNDFAPLFPMLLPVDMKREMERVICWWLSFVCLLSFVFTTKIEFS